MIPTLAQKQRQVKMEGAMFAVQFAMQDRMAGFGVIANTSDESFEDYILAHVRAFNAARKEAP